jgi:hypothetical protein
MATTRADQAGIAAATKQGYTCFMSRWGDCDTGEVLYCPTLVVSLCRTHHEETHGGRQHEVEGHSFLCLKKGRK